MNITRHIPNAITSMNLLCGVLGVINAFSGRFDMAFYLMLAAAVCDFLDGLSARVLKAYSDLGKELDSLADMVSFGLLPSVILYRLMIQETGSTAIWCHVPLIITVFSALRLAKFNIDERQGENFIGLATPACAMICGSLAYYITKVDESFLTAWSSGYVFIPVLSVLLSLLLVSEIPMFSIKFKKGTGRKDTPLHRQRTVFFGMAAASALLVVTLGLNWS